MKIKCSTKPLTGHKWYVWCNRDDMYHHWPEWVQQLWNWINVDYVLERKLPNRKTTKPTVP